MSSGGIFDLSSKEVKLGKLQKKTLAPDFWNNNFKASSILKKTAILEKEINLWKDLKQRHGDVEVLLEFAKEGESTVEEVDVELSTYQKIVEDLELQLMLGEVQDVQDAILTIHPGAGGTESQDWAEMLYRMYTRWFEKKKFLSALLDYQPGDEAGIKDVTLEVKGEFAYGLLKAEAGVHRLVRISPFDASNRRHTSFASVFVYPSVDEDVEIEIDSNDLRIDTYRASGAGGQHVNKTDSAVRITHLPSKLVVQCQDEKSQHKNRAKAMKLLRSKLYNFEQLQVDQARAANRKNQVGTGDRSERIRTYNFPQGRVTDHRINLTLYKLDRVMEGDLDEIIDALTAEEQATLLASV